MPTVLPSARVSSELSLARPAEAIPLPETVKVGFQEHLPPSSPAAAATLQQKADAAGTTAEIAASLGPIAPVLPPDATPKAPGDTSLRPGRLFGKDSTSKSQDTLEKDAPATGLKVTAQPSAPPAPGGQSPQAAIITTPPMSALQPKAAEETAPSARKFIALAATPAVQQMHQKTLSTAMRTETATATTPAVESINQPFLGSAPAQLSANVSLPSAMPATNAGDRPGSFPQPTHGAMKSNEIAAQLANALPRNASINPILITAGLPESGRHLQFQAAPVVAAQSNNHPALGSAPAQLGANISLPLATPATHAGDMSVSFPQPSHGATKSNEITGQFANALPKGALSAQPRLALHVALSPQHLGTVTVKVTRDLAGSANVTITATQPETLAALKKDEASINQILTTAGLPESGRHLHFQAAPVAAAQSSTELTNNPGSMQGGAGHRDAQRNGTSLANHFLQPPAEATPMSATAPGFARSGVDMIA